MYRSIKGKTLLLLVEVYPEEEANQLPMHIGYIFPCNSVYDIPIRRLTLDFFDLQSREYISEYWKRSHKQHSCVEMVSRHSNE